MAVNDARTSVFRVTSNSRQAGQTQTTIWKRSRWKRRIWKTASNKPNLRLTEPKSSFSGTNMILFVFMWNALVGRLGGCLRVSNGKQQIEAHQC